MIGKQIMSKFEDAFEMVQRKAGAGQELHPALCGEAANAAAILVLADVLNSISLYDDKVAQSLDSIGFELSKQK